MFVPNRKNWVGPMGTVPLSRPTTQAPAPAPRSMGISGPRPPPAPAPAPAPAFAPAMMGTGDPRSTTPGRPNSAESRVKVVEPPSAEKMLQILRKKGFGLREL